MRIHFYPASESVLLDFDLKEITSQEALDALVDLLRAVATSIHKSLTISSEGDGPAFVYVLDRDVLERGH